MHLIEYQENTFINAIKIEQLFIDDESGCLLFATDQDISIQYLTNEDKNVFCVDRKLKNSFLKSLKSMDQNSSNNNLDRYIDK